MRSERIRFATQDGDVLEIIFIPAQLVEGEVSTLPLLTASRGLFGSSASRMAEETPDLRWQITAVLNSIGMSPKLKGYGYARRAIEIVVCERGVVKGITKRLYPQIAAEYNTTPQSVERSIRNAIYCTWNVGGKETFYDITHYPTDIPPTNGQFIALLTDYFRTTQGRMPAYASR